MFLLEATPSAKAGFSAWEDRVCLSRGLHSAKGNINLIHPLQRWGKHLLRRHFGDWANIKLYQVQDIWLGSNKYEKGH